MMIARTPEPAVTARTRKGDYCDENFNRRPGDRDGCLYQFSLPNASVKDEVD
jgi:hypothetical protein